MLYSLCSLNVFLITVETFLGLVVRFCESRYLLIFGSNREFWLARVQLAGKDNVRTENILNND